MGSAWKHLVAPVNTLVCDGWCWVGRQLPVSPRAPGLAPSDCGSNWASINLHLRVALPFVLAVNCYAPPTGRYSVDFLRPPNWYNNSIAREKVLPHHQAIAYCSPLFLCLSIFTFNYSSPVYCNCLNVFSGCSILRGHLFIYSEIYCKSEILYCLLLLFYLLALAIK